MNSNGQKHKGSSQMTAVTTSSDEKLLSVDQWVRRVAESMKDLSTNEAARKKIAQHQS